MLRRRNSRLRTLCLALLTALLCTVTLLIAPGPADASSVGSCDNGVIADYAISHYPVGSYGGQFRTFVNNVVKASTGIDVGTGWPDYFKGFTAVGATQIADVNALAKGDVVQYGQTEAYQDLHTLIIVSRVSGATYNVIDSNEAYNEKVMRYDRTVVLNASQRAYRLGRALGAAPGYGVAFEANTASLWTAGAAGTGDHRLGMMRGTSPAVAAVGGGGYEIAFQANTGHLWTTGARGTVIGASA